MENGLERMLGTYRMADEKIPESEYDKHHRNNDKDTNDRMDHQHTDDDDKDTSQGYGGAENNQYKH